MDHTLLLTKLARVARTQCDSDLEQFRSSWVAFELVCALEKSEELQRNVYLWPDVDSDIKDKLGLPQEDIGIDYMDKECSFAGQAKCYISTTRVPTSDIDRTRFCMYRGSRYAKEDILPRCEIATPSSDRQKYASPIFLYVPQIGQISSVVLLSFLFRVSVNCAIHVFIFRIEMLGLGSFESESCESSMLNLAQRNFKMTSFGRINKT